MKKEIENMIKKIDLILKDETASVDWMKGRHSAFRGVRKELQEILNKNSPCYKAKHIHP